MRHHSLACKRTHANALPYITLSRASNFVQVPRAPCAVLSATLHPIPLRTHTRAPTSAHVEGESRGPGARASADPLEVKLRIY